jgi:hypothetical protein
MSIQFSDGVKFDTSGDLRLEFRHDGAYVVGQGMLIPVRDGAEAAEVIERFKQKNA